MEKDDIKEIQEGKRENDNIEAFRTILGQENTGNESKNTCMKVITASILDQSIVVVGSAALLFLVDLVLKLFGYMFVKEAGVLLLAGGIIYFVLNCIYQPIMEKTNMKNTIAKKILNIN